MDRARTVLVIFSMWVSPAFAHGWFTGATDPITGWGCCNNKDCSDVEDSDVRAEGDGYVYIPTGEYIPRERIQQSKTWRFARCEQQYDSSFKGTPIPKGSTRCFFEPGGF